MRDRPFEDTMQVDEERYVEATPSAVWAALTEPRHQDSWRAERIVGWLPGDGGGPGSVGALWLVRPRGSGRVRTEVVSHAEVRRRLVVHRTESLSFRDWIAEITLHAEGAGTRVHWSERRGTWRPDQGRLARKLAREVRGRLAALGEHAGAHPDTAVAQPAPADPDFERDSLQREALLAHARRCRAEQRELAGRFAARGDQLQFFARVYELLTARAIDWACEDKMAHPGWALRLVPEFHRWYMHNLRAWEDARHQEVEAHWRRAFLAITGEDGIRERAPARMMRGMLYAVQAHVDEDLPRALARVHLEHYADRCDFDRFRADFVLLRRMFTEANDDFVAAIPFRFTPLHLHVAQRVTPTEVLEFLRNRIQYDVPAGRLAAFERGKRLLAELGVGGSRGGAALRVAPGRAAR